MQYTLQSVYIPNRVSQTLVTTIVVISQQDMHQFKQSFFSFDLEQLYYSGWVIDVKSLSSSQGLLYEVSLVPWFYLLKEKRHSRVFTNCSLQEILTTLFKAYLYADYHWGCLRHYTCKFHWIQYQESDFNFITRLCDFYGVNYFYRYSQQRCQLVFFDDASSYTYPACSPNGMRGIRHQWQFLPSRVTVHHDDPFRSTRHQSTSQLLSVCLHQHNLEYKVYSKQRLTVIKEQVCTAYHCAKIESNDQRLLLAQVIRCDDDYVIVAVEHYWTVYNGYMNQIECHSLRRPYQAQHVYHTPQWPAPLKAKVVSKVDYFARVKLLFSWDENQSMTQWVRIRQVWNGALFCPRIGDWVWVDFQEGDINQLVVVGQVRKITDHFSITYPMQITMSQQGVHYQLTSAAYFEALQKLAIEAKQSIVLSVKNAIICDAIKANIKIKAQSITLQVGHALLVLNNNGLCIKAPSVVLN